MMKEEIIKFENLVYKKLILMNDNGMYYCLGCSYGVVYKLIVEVIEEMGLEDKVVGILFVGCVVFIYNYFDIDWQEVVYGCVLVFVIVIKCFWLDCLVFIYQGDGDFVCIGMVEIIYVLNCGENIMIIFINNVIYGMIGGQMVFIILMGMKIVICFYGCDLEFYGYLLKIIEIVV